MKRLILAAVASAVVLSAAGLARTDSLTAIVKSYDGSKQFMTLVTGEIIELKNCQDIIPPTLSADDEIMMDFSSSEDGFTGISSITISVDRCTSFAANCRKKAEHPAFFHT
jgi:hypothetical protein